MPETLHGWQNQLNALNRQKVRFLSIKINLVQDYPANLTTIDSLLS